VKTPVHLWRLNGLDRLQLMRAHLSGRAFGRHGHETFAVGVVQEGAEEIRFRDGVERVGPGGVVFINPEVVHTGVAIGDGWQYRVAYPSVGIMREIGGGLLPSFRHRLSYDRRAARLIAEAHSAAETEDPLTAESMLSSALARLLRAYGTLSSSATETPALGRSLIRAHDLLHERLTDPPSLEQLATETGVPPFTLLRSFREAYGLPPHAFLTQLRVRRARALLETGLSPAEVAVSVGFFDQAHLSRHFRRIVGVPPGTYQRGGNFVQAAGGESSLA
jgi:AraC-like DNA-binding protein